MVGTESSNKGTNSRLLRFGRTAPFSSACRDLREHASGPEPLRPNGFSMITKSGCGRMVSVAPRERELSGAVAVARGRGFDMTDATPTEYRYVIRRHDDIVTVDDWRVMPEEGKRVVGQVGPFTQIENNGKVRKDVVRLLAHDRHGLRDWFGRERSNGVHQLLKRSAAGVKEMLRRVRPEEAARLAEYDKQIAHLDEEIARLRRERRDFMRTQVWPKAHVVRLAEVEERLT